MGVWLQYKLRLQRKRLRSRAMRKRRELTAIRKPGGRIKPNDILLFATIRNERKRLPFFLEYYRNLGVNHFMIVDNGSDDSSLLYLEKQKDVSVWTTDFSYKRSRFGMDWINGLMSAFAVGHWCLVVDVDEFFVYPHCDTRPLRALTDWLDSSHTRTFGAVLVDTYPKGDFAKANYKEGDDPVELARYFDSGNYSYDRNKKFGNLYIQGGVRERVMFADKPAYAPALNKIPLIKWAWHNAYASSTHNLLPRGLNKTYDSKGGQRACGCLLHTKFLNMFAEKAEEEIVRRQHYAASREYKAYANSAKSDRNLWTEHSTEYKDWRQLEKLGLLATGDWA